MSTSTQRNATVNTINAIFNIAMSLVSPENVEDARELLAAMERAASLAQRAWARLTDSVDALGFRRSLERPEDDTLIHTIITRYEDSQQERP